MMRATRSVTLIIKFIPLFSNTWHSQSIDQAQCTFGTWTVSTLLPPRRGGNKAFQAVAREARHTKQLPTAAPRPE